MRQSLLAALIVLATPALAQNPAPVKPGKATGPTVQQPSQIKQTMPKQQTGAKPAVKAGPMHFTAQSLTATGTGALAARGAFTPRTFTAESLAVTGTGALAARGAFAPRTFTSSSGLAVTGTGALR